MLHMNKLIFNRDYANDVCMCHRLYSKCDKYYRIISTVLLEPSNRPIIHHSLKHLRVLDKAASYLIKALMENVRAMQNLRGRQEYV